MPISKYFQGHGEKVMKNMKNEYGAKKGKSVFYATANKRGVTGSGPFTASEQKQGFKVMYTASDLLAMDYERDTSASMAKRRLPKTRQWGNS